jgi:uncharacterized glyoxalase superfamily protein PhnB
MTVTLNQLDLVARDVERSIAFYRALGIRIPKKAVWRTASGTHHVDIALPNGLTLHFDSTALARVYNKGWRTNTTGGNAVFGFTLKTRRAVDATYARLTKAGHKGLMPPYDAFWGARYAIVGDPDGNHVGLMSPSDPKRRGQPPDL